MKGPCQANKERNSSSRLAPENHHTHQISAERAELVSRLHHRFQQKGACTVGGVVHWQTKVDKEKNPQVPSVLHLAVIHVGYFTKSKLAKHDKTVTKPSKIPERVGKDPNTVVIRPSLQSRVTQGPEEKRFSKCHASHVILKRDKFFSALRGYHIWYFLTNFEVF